jgi:hypothetical protein
MDLDVKFVFYALCCQEVPVLCTDTEPTTTCGLVLSVFELVYVLPFRAPSWDNRYVMLHINTWRTILHIHGSHVPAARDSGATIQVHGQVKSHSDGR